jgi:hypothetical protein
MKRNFLEEKKFIKGFYILLIFILGLTGFAQMPIFKRYYIADIPGLGWLGNFYATHYIHYIGAALFFALAAYCVTAYFLSGKHQFSLSWSAYIRIALIMCIMITGVFRVLKNFPNIVFSPAFTIFIDISHLIFMFFLMIAAIFFLAIKSRWIEPESGV